MKPSSLARVLDDSHLQSLIVELMTEKVDILPLITLSKAWHSIAQPALFRSLSLNSADQTLKVANAMEHWQAQGRATLSWIRELCLDFDVLDLDHRTADLPRWTDAAIRIVAQAQNTRTLRLYPCSPAMLGVARAVCARALRSLDLTFVPPRVPFASVACLSQFSNLHTLELMMIPSSIRWTPQQPMFAPGGHFPILRRLVFSGSSSSRFFPFLVSSSFGALEHVDLQCDDTSPEDREHLHVFLRGHNLQRLVYNGADTQSVEQILHILQHVRATQVGIYLWHLQSPYTEIVQAIPQATRTWVVDYETGQEELIESLIRVFVQVPASGIEAVLVQEPGSPFHWINVETIDSSNHRVGHRLTKVLGWAAMLAKRGIRMLDEDGKTLRESTAMIP